MKKYICLSLCATLCGTVATAQVEKRVEVVKDYLPTVTTSPKLAVEPNMTDTVTLRPDIDYSITPRAVSKQLEIRDFKPATVTYWEFRRRYPFYAKVGAGYPWNSVVDIYASTHRKDRGYVTGYINHWGKYSDIKNDYGLLRNAVRAANKIGVDGGYYFGRRILEAAASYGINLDHRYATYLATDAVKFEDAQFAVHFGDSFSELKTFNFDIHAQAKYFNDKSRNDFAERYRQASAAGGVSLARAFGGRHTLRVDVDYRGEYGLKTLSPFDQNTAIADLRYAYAGGKIADFAIGAAYCFDKIDTRSTSHYVLPRLMLKFNVGHGLFVPYIAADGSVRNNTYSALLHRNHYFVYGATGVRPMPSTVTYDARIGFGGHTRKAVFAYRLWAAAEFMENDVYWYSLNDAWLQAATARRDRYSLNVEFDLKPTSQFTLSAAARGYLIKDKAEVEGRELCGGEPQAEGSLKMTYALRRLTLGARADAVGVRKWSAFRSVGYSHIGAIFTAPAYVDVSAWADWRIKGQWTVFTELGNLANMDIYRTAAYKEYGINFTAGVKVQF